MNYSKEFECNEIMEALAQVIAERIKKSESEERMKRATPLQLHHINEKTTPQKQSSPKQ